MDNMIIAIPGLIYYSRAKTSRNAHFIHLGGVKMIQFIWMYNSIYYLGLFCSILVNKFKNQERYKEDCDTAVF